MNLTLSPLSKYLYKEVYITTRSYSSGQLQEYPAWIMEIGDFHFSILKTVGKDPEKIGVRSLGRVRDKSLTLFLSGFGGLTSPLTIWESEEAYRQHTVKSELWNEITYYMKTGIDYDKITTNQLRGVCKILGRSEE